MFYRNGTPTLSHDGTRKILTYLVSSRELLQSFPCLLNEILFVLNESSTKIRSRAIRSLSLIIESDPNILGWVNLVYFLLLMFYYLLCIIYYVLCIYHHHLLNFVWFVSFMRTFFLLYVIYLTKHSSPKLQRVSKGDCSITLFQCVKPQSICWVNIFYTNPNLPHIIMSILLIVWRFVCFFLFEL
jgi:hypothetical protein